MQPDFLCFGSTRTGTSYLHNRLREHPAIWMPPEKEIHYFDDQRTEGFFSRKHMRHVSEAIPNLRAAVRGKRGAGQELAWQLRYFFGRRSDAWYLSLFDVPPDLITGAIEPGYAKLDPRMLRVVYGLMPDTKLLYLMRDPIDRAWSSITKSLAKNKKRSMASVSADEIRSKLARSSIWMSTYIEHIRRWEEVYPSGRIFFGFFEEIERDPSAFLNRVCEFLNVAHFPRVDRDVFAQPVNHTRGYKTAIPDSVEHDLAEQLLDPTRALARRFGGYPEKWLERMERIVNSPRVAA